MNHCLKLMLGLSIIVVLGAACSSGNLTDSEGESFSLADYKGQWLVLNYWAEWCAPCIEEIPELNALDADTQNGVAVLGVNFDMPEQNELREQMKKLQVKFRVLSTDPSDSLAEFFPEVLPTTYIFDPTGLLQHRLQGPQTGEEILTLLKSDEVAAQ